MWARPSTGYQQDEANDRVAELDCGHNQHVERYVQYWHFLVQLVHGNLAYDYYHGESVNSIIAQAFPITLSLVIGAAVVWLTIGVLFGVASAVRPPR